MEPTDEKFTYSDMNRTLGEILNIAMVEPVIMTERGKDKIVIMNIDKYEKLRTHYALFGKELPPTNRK